MSGSQEERFRSLYAAHFRDLLGFALRRTTRPEDAADAVADTFLVAWRRSADVPPGSEARLWLYGTCRRVLANVERGNVRRDRLGARLRDTLGDQAQPDPAAYVPEALVVRDAMERLSDSDRELLRLSSWEGLQPHEIAVVMGLPPRTVRTRLSRARARLRELLGDVRTQSGHVMGDEQPTGLTSKEGR